MFVVKLKYFFPIWCFSIAVALCATAKADSWEQQFHQELQHWLGSKASTVWGCDRQRIDLHAELLRFYQYRNYQPAWVDSSGLRPAGVSVLSLAQQAKRQGVSSPEGYNRILDDLYNGMRSVSMADRAVHIERYIKLDVMLTGMVLRYAFYLDSGRIDPSIFEWSNTSRKSAHRELAVELSTMLDKGRLAEFLEQLGPQHTAYHALQKSLPKFRELKAAGGWPHINRGPTLKLGDQGPRVAVLRDRLNIDQDTVAESAGRNDRFDDALGTAVMRFQHRHGLKADGKVGPATLAAMNVPVAQRIRQIELNLERWRWMPPKLEPFYIRVNIPDFELKVVVGEQPIKTMRVIVGREDRPTPMLSSKVTYVELNPYWRVPSKIARKDLLPKIQKDPQFLVQQDFQVFDSREHNARALDPFSIDWAALNENNFPYRLQQKPSPHNALGRIKFIFLNEFSVYIHDTPTKGYFSRLSRSLSSGCVRVEKPLELADFLLRRQNWDSKRLDKVMTSGKRQAVALKVPFPIYFVYMTAWAEENGEVHFRKDIYGHDQHLQTLLTALEKAEQRCAAAIVPTYSVQNQPADHLSSGAN